jgi:type I restriction-modification system DNA methylase subunit
MKKEETNDIIQFLLPLLDKHGIRRQQCKVDVTTEKTGKKRGDVWISKNEQTHKDFEKNIITLIEAKHRNCEIGDIDWRDAMKQGKEKTGIHGLNYYIVTNCITNFRFYNSHTDEEILLDGKILTQLQTLDILEKIQTQVNPENSYVVHKSSKETAPFSESKFRTSLKKLADIYRSAGLKKGDERIDPTVSFVVLKYIGEKESEHRTLPNKVKLWKDYGQEKGDYVGDFAISVKYIFNGTSSPYRDFKDLVSFPNKLKDEHYRQIYDEINRFHFHGCSFDVFGAIYEEFASQTKKKEFGEFYTRRHIAGIVARLLLRNEITGHDLKICDPACGTGGFLTEAYKTLINNYSKNGKLDKPVKNKLTESTFWGIDNDPHSVARTKLNMFLVGDGHTHIYEIEDSLDGWKEEVLWRKNAFDYIITNPPMGSYKGVAKIENFKFTNEKRNELLFVEKVIEATKPGGEIAIVINDGALEAPSRENYRIKLLAHCNIYAIISLTKFAFAPYTKEKTYVLFIQKKQEDKIGGRQDYPIWHFIVDYDGFANSDKRYKTKFHDDLGELEEKFDEAVNLARLFISNREKFEKERSIFEREINQREKEEGLTGIKYGYVEMDSINDENYHNLLSEYYLRPYEEKKISEKEYDKKSKEIIDNLKNILKIIP